MGFLSLSSTFPNLILEINLENKLYGVKRSLLKHIFLKSVNSHFLIYGVKLYFDVKLTKLHF